MRLTISVKTNNTSQKINSAFSRIWILLNIVIKDFISAAISWHFNDLILASLLTTMFKRLFPFFSSLLLTFVLAFGIPLTGNSHDVVRQDQTELVSQQKKKNKVHSWCYEQAAVDVKSSFSNNLEVFHSIQVELRLSNHEIGFVHQQPTFKYYHLHPISDEIPLI